jgi:crotonobetainyl-CoA:carnitine CoA-transferase CaiB-like acyl-CoA transferase
MNGVLATRSKSEWLAAFDAAGVPAGPVHDIGEALTHPQTLARGMVVDLVHPEAGATRALGPPLHFSATPTRIDRPAPMLGEHTREVLREHGYTEEEIRALADEGVVELSPARAEGAAR